jgi:lysophospholipase L1-like esterase
MLADSRRWPGEVMNRGFAGARLIDFCNSLASCAAYADTLDRDYPHAAAYYFALGTNDFKFEQHCAVSNSFPGLLSSLLQELHKRNANAVLYVQTPIHRADEAQPNLCGKTLIQFEDAERRMVQNVSWLMPIDGFSTSFPQAAQGSSVSVDGIHPTVQGQEQYFQAVLQSLHLGA